MKPLSWDKQLGLALPLERAASQSDETNHPSKNEVGLDVSHHTHVSPEGRGKYFFLDILSHRMSAIACSRQPSTNARLACGHGCGFPLSAARDKEGKLSAQQPSRPRFRPFQPLPVLTRLRCRFRRSCERPSVGQARLHGLWRRAAPRW